MTNDRYLHIWPSGGDLTEAYLADEEIEAEGWWCAACRSPRPETKKINIRINSKKPENNPVCRISGFFVGIVSLELLDILDPEDIKNCLYLGRVEDCNGFPLADWMTVRARNRVIVRGSSHASTRLCDACGYRPYFAMPPNYIFPPISSKFAVSQSQLSGLVFSADYANRLDGIRMKGVTVEELPVFKAPLDGLGEFSN